MIPQRIGKENSTFRGNLTPAKLPQQKPITAPELTPKEAPTVIRAKHKSLFPKPPREMIWKKINGQLVAEWISTD